MSRTYRTEAADAGTGDEEVITRYCPYQRWWNNRAVETLEIPLTHNVRKLPNDAHAYPTPRSGPPSQPLFRRTLPDLVVAVGAAGAATALFVVAPATPFRMVLMTVAFFAGGGGAAALAAAPLIPVFRITVDVLPSLDSLKPLIRRAVRVPVALAGGGGAATAAPLRPLAAAVPPTAELAVEDVVVFRVAAARVDRAFSTMFVRRLVAVACFAGDTGRAINDLAGDDGMAAGSRGFSLEFDEVGDRILAGSGRVPGASCPRSFFFG